MVACHPVDELANDVDVAGVSRRLLDHVDQHPAKRHRPLALVTGASSGIGLELARQFVENGFDVIINAEDDELQAAESSTPRP